ncbi:uncharacterized protein BXIN_1276 [Babesia sp. Xinjiang]|uniref:uncharacterized protein n=1 Tax=Babesia sp. Xinjiang TaxID=462227 RepID=UPI000A223428|nr:uncharacterized protein BXIN_1276 [Babesia sp. Xinjiang]ORM40018.1 hypothetical protein BXIN_1276 [Babesia sp. Xinjiang]
MISRCSVATVTWIVADAEGPFDGRPLEDLTQEDDISELPLCKDILTPDSAAIAYCLNGSTCRVGSGSENHAQLVCDCREIATQDFFFAGPQCATKVRRKYRIQQAFNLDSTVQVINTCLIEDVLGMNQWKNDVSSVGHLPL